MKINMQQVHMLNICKQAMIITIIVLYHYKFSLKNVIKSLPHIQLFSLSDKSYFLEIFDMVHS